MKDFRGNKSETRFQFLALQKIKQMYNKAKKEKKKDCCNCDQNRSESCKAQKGSILAQKTNTINLSANKNRNRPR